MLGNNPRTELKHYILLNLLKVMEDDLKQINKSHISKGTKVILIQYFSSCGPKQSLTVTFKIGPAFPAGTQTFIFIRYSLFSNVLIVNVCMCFQVIPPILESNMETDFIHVRNYKCD